MATSLAVLAGGLLLTDGAPDVAETGPPDAAQASTAQGFLERLRRGEGGGLLRVGANAEELRAVSVLASNGLRPTRIELTLDEWGLAATASRPLRLGRWLNVRAQVTDGGAGFPSTRLGVGSVTLGPDASRWAMELGRRALRMRGVEVPALDGLVRGLRFAGNGASAEVDVTAAGALASGLLGQARALAGQGGAGQGGAGDIYCRLAEREAVAPVSDFSALVRRAFAMDPGSGSIVQANRASIVALAMLAVDPRIGYLAQVPASGRGCAGVPIAVSLHGRTDSPRHWLVSAALAVTAGAQLSQSAGEWKELADSVSRRAEFAPGDSTGFSLVDIGADRAGELIALAAVTPAYARELRRALARSEDNDLMPPGILHLEDGMRAADFVGIYGSTQDPRYRAVLGRIDRMILSGTPAGIGRP